MEHNVRYKYIVTTLLGFCIGFFATASVYGMDEREDHCVQACAATPECGRKKFLHGVGNQLLECSICLANEEELSCAGAEQRFCRHCRQLLCLNCARRWAEQSADRLGGKFFECPQCRKIVNIKTLAAPKSFERNVVVRFGRIIYKMIMTSLAWMEINRDSLKLYDLPEIVLQDVTQGVDKNEQTRRSGNFVKLLYFLVLDELCRFVWAEGTPCDSFRFPKKLLATGFLHGVGTISEAQQRYFNRCFRGIVSAAFAMLQDKFLFGKEVALVEGESAGVNRLQLRRRNLFLLLEHFNTVVKLYPDEVRPQSYYTGEFVENYTSLLAFLATHDDAGQAYRACSGQCCNHFSSDDESCDDKLDSDESSEDSFDPHVSLPDKSQGGDETPDETPEESTENKG